MKRPLRRKTLMATTTCLAFGLAVVPATANPSTSWTANPNPAAISGVNSGPTSLTAGVPLVCTQSSLQGSMFSAVGNPATVATLGTLTFGSTTSPCQSVLGGATFTPTAPWRFVAQDHNPATGVTTGYLEGVQLSVAVSFCRFTTAGKASATYRSSTGVFSVNSVPGELAVTGALGCGTTITTSTLPVLKGNFLIKILGTSTAPTLTGSNP
ncbi:hypothetical protein CNQ36_33760 (plasmid) [Streptomyces fungicidicus]|uniref:Tat pathway signal sequence domain protein n=2 Tax=Streptomyces fungicidicus TaxID=68203 RepID=A0A494V9V2_9ACTN|nr:hypothetical protein [Streptomyces fungicidicus]AYL40379.1 hypothetical protein CNQ36_33760 [Streptomyces fungicidicus]